MGWGYGEDKVAKGIGDYVTGRQTGANWGSSPEGAFGASQHKSAGNKGGGSGGSGGGCFPSGTKIATPRGELSIEELHPGEDVFSFNKKRGIIEVNRILRINEHAENPVWEIQFEDGSQVRTTPVHSFLAGNSWKMARRVAPGERLLSLDSLGKTNTRAIVKSKMTNQKETVYNLIVDKNYSFIADGMLVHSFTYLRSLRASVWSLLSIFSRKGNAKTTGKPASVLGNFAYPLEKGD